MYSVLLDLRERTDGGAGVSRFLSSAYNRDEKGKMRGWFLGNSIPRRCRTHDRAESQLHKEGDRQASIRDLAN